MNQKKSRSPQEKKALSYVKDRRNTYGENDKASRKAIPLRKALENRHSRRQVAQDLASIPKVDEGAAELLESSALHDVHRVGGWTKGADEPLGKVVAAALDARITRAARKKRSAEQVIANKAMDDPDALLRMAKGCRRFSKWLLRRYPMQKEHAARFDQHAADYEMRALELKQQPAKPEL